MLLSQAHCQGTWSEVVHCNMQCQDYKPLSFYSSENQAVPDQILWPICSFRRLPCFHQPMSYFAELRSLKRFSLPRILRMCYNTVGKPSLTIPIYLITVLIRNLGNSNTSFLLMPLAKQQMIDKFWSCSWIWPGPILDAAAERE